MNILLLILLSVSAFAWVPSQGKDEFCKDRKNPQFVKELTQYSNNLMGFENEGGLIGGGVCWWHSRFQRNALYLTAFNPDLPKPTEGEAVQLIRDIRFQNGIVEIPGFRNFLEFSLAYQREIQKELNRWQRFEALRGTWIRGLRGSAIVKPEFLKKLMDDIYEEVEVNGNIAYNKLQMKGIVAHSWLVVNMEKRGNGYILEILDSNFPYRTSFYEYREGDTNLEYEEYGPFVPYLEFKNEMQWLKETIAENCP